MIFALINVNMTPLVIFIYIIFEVDLNNRKYSTNEDLMPYKIADLYYMTREHVCKFYLTHFTFVLYAFYTGAVIFLIYYIGILESGGVLSSNGQTQDLFCFGVVTIMTFVLQHHIHVALMLKNWTWLFGLLWLFSLAQLPITYVFAESLMAS